MNSGLITRRCVGLVLAAAMLAPQLARASEHSDCTDACSQQYYRDMASCFGEDKAFRKRCKAEASTSRTVCHADCGGAVRTSHRSSHRSRRRR